MVSINLDLLNSDIFNSAIIDKLIIIALSTAVSATMNYEL